MKLATLKVGSRDGSLVVASRDLKTCCSAGAIADRTLLCELQEQNTAMQIL